MCQEQEEIFLMNRMCLLINLLIVPKKWRAIIVGYQRINCTWNRIGPVNKHFIRNTASALMIKCEDLSNTVFAYVFGKNNLSFFRPQKKGECDI